MFIEIEQKSGRIYILIFIFRALDLTNSLKTFLLIALPAAVGIVAGLLTLETNNTREISAGSSRLVLLKKPGDVLHRDRPGRCLVLLPGPRPGGLQSLHLFLAEKAILSFYDVHGIRPDLNDQRLAIIKNNKNQTNNLPHCRPQPFISRIKSLHLLHSQQLDVIKLVLKNDHHLLNTQLCSERKTFNRTSLN